MDNLGYTAVHKRGDFIAIYPTNGEEPIVVRESDTYFPLVLAVVQKEFPLDKVKEAAA